VPFGFVVAAGLSAGFTSAGFVSVPLGSVPFGLVSAGLVSAGFTSAGFGAVLASSCVANFVNFASNSAILDSKSFFVLALLFAAIPYSKHRIVYLHFDHPKILFKLISKIKQYFVKITIVFHQSGSQNCNTYMQLLQRHNLTWIPLLGSAA
jgi:hypothetical protein